MSLTALAQQIPTLDFFHGRECPHCHAEKAWFPTLKQAYPDIVINQHEVWHDAENQALWAERLSALGETPSGVPSNVIGDVQVVGFVPTAILAVLEDKYGPPAVDTTTITTESTTSKPASKGLDLGFILIVLGGIGLAAGIVFFGKKS